MSNFTREIKDIGALKQQLLSNGFLKKVNAEMIQTGKVLLAFRNNNATLYYLGRQLCKLDHKYKDENNNTQTYGPTIYNHYLPVVRSDTLLGKQRKNWHETAYAQKTGGCNFSTVLPEILDNGALLETLSASLFVIRRFVTTPSV